MRKFYLLIFIATLFLPLYAEATIGVVAHTGKQGDGTGTTITDAIDTSGATLIVVGVGYLNATAPVLSDSYGNSWTPLTPTSASGLPDVVMYYSVNPIVGAGHTFTANGGAAYASMNVIALSGAGDFDQENGSTGSGPGILPGSVTPTENNEIVITVLGYNDSQEPVSIDGLFVVSDSQNYLAGNSFGGALAYEIQTSASISNPLWSTFNTGSASAAIATFKALSVIASAQSHKTKAPNNLGLVGYWSLNDGSGTKATDFSGRGNTGTLTNSPTWVNGKFGKALKFSAASTQYVDVGNPTALQITGDMTISTWVKLDSLPSAGDAYQLVAKDNDTGGRAYTFDVYNDTGGAIYGTNGTVARLYINGGAGNQDNGSNLIASNVILSVGVWYHVVGVYNTSGTLDLYINGVSAHAQRTGESSSIPSATASVFLGAREYPGVEGYLDGTMDEVRIYNRSLSAAEVKALYNNSGATKINSSQTNLVTGGLVGYWSFNGADISGTTAYDRSASGNNGTMTGGPTKVAGKVGQALSLNGSSQYVDIPALNITTSNATFAGWIYSRVSTQSLSAGIIYSRHAGHPVGMTYDVDEGTELAYTWNDGDSATWNFDSNLVIPANEWVYTAVAIEPTKATLYLCRISNGCTSSVNAISHISQTLDTHFNIGYDEYDSSRIFNGKVDEMRIYNRTLSASEIQALFNAGK